MWKCAPYDHARDRSLITPWCAARGVTLPDDMEVPAIGFLVGKDETAVCAAFLRLVEGGHAQLDGLVTNPDSSSQDRNEAIDIVTTKIIAEAKALNVKTIITFVDRENTILRAEVFGFKRFPHTLLILNLEQ
jgi:hypothetical protein